MRHPSVKGRSPIDLIVLDSVPGLVSTATLSSEVGDTQVAAGARIIKQFFDVYKNDLKDSGTALLLINQIRAQIGGFSPHGPAESIPGGYTLKFFSWIIARVNVPEAITKHGEIIAKKFSVTVRKNKLAPAGRKAEFVVFLDGHNMPYIWGELASVGKALGVFTKEDGVTPASQGYWYFEGEKLAIGEAQVTEMLKNDADLAERVEAAIRAALEASAQVAGPEEVLED